MFRDDRVFDRQPRASPSTSSSSSAYIGARPAVGGRLLQDAEDPLGPRQAARAGRSTTSPMARPAREVVDRHADRRDTGSTRVDILHDVGRSLNPAIDIGQIEGGFVQGMGWLTTEELVFDDEGRLLHARAVDLQDPGRLRRAGAISASRCIRTRNREDTIYRSKAVGEPPLMLAISVFCAHRRRDPCARARQAGAARRAGDAGGDPARLRGAAREADGVTVWRQPRRYRRRARRRRAGHRA